MKKVLPLFTAIIFLASCTIKVDKDFTKYVDPFIGTGGHGHTYPGACMPFGMVQLSPDTRLEGWDGCSGYHYSDSVIYGFSHTHLSGTGASDYGDILFMPTTGKVILDNGYNKSYDSGYCSLFSHANEQARPGFYHVKLDKYQVDVDLTVTRRAGFHKYTFPKTAEANVIIDLVHRDQVLEASLEMVSDTEVAGFRRSRHWASDQRIYFVARFSRPFKSSGISRNDTLLDGIQKAEGKSIKGFLRFESQGNDPLLVKVGISAVSLEGARKNLEAEIPGWDFDKAAADANDAWNKELGKIHVEGGSREQIRTFYTALYHAMLAPNLFMDVDGQYLGRDLLPHQANGFDYYTVFSLWDTYRAAHPLYTILDQKRTVDFVQTFIRQYEEGGLLPVWELGANETWCMIGYHAVPVIADAYLKGIQGYDAEKAFEACLNSARKDHLGLASFKKYGYIQGFDEGESVSKTLEYAYDDWTIAQMARKMDKQAEYEEFIQRAQYYKNVYDPTTGFMRAKMNGTWFTPFDPFEVNFNYTEANAWQYSFYVPQDVSGMIRYMGGDDSFTEKLDKLFSASTQTTGLDQADITGLIGQYAHGNEPSHHMAYLYAYAGKAWETQRMARKIMNTQYSDKHDGLCGNEDCGQMSAWYVLSAMGFYPVTPGSNVYVIGSPLFKKVTIHLENGKTFTIETTSNSARNFYIRSAKLNGEDHLKSYITHQDIMNGGTMVFQMGSKPNQNWGTAEDHRPVSAITDQLITPVPFIDGSKRTFIDSLQIVMGNAEKDALILYTLNDPNLADHSVEYKGPFIIREKTALQSFASSPGKKPSKVMFAEFNPMDGKQRVVYNSPYASRYAAGGDLALIDGIRGPLNFKTGTWQGFEGIDLDVILDLGEVKPIKSIDITFIQDARAWIFLPEYVEFSVAEEDDFKTIGRVANDIPDNQMEITTKTFEMKGIPGKARYIKIIGKNIEKVPTWHPGAGGKAWVFADEIEVKYQ